MAKALLKNASYLHLRVHNGWGVYQNHPQGHLPTILPVVVERWMALELGQGNVDIAQAFRSDHQLQRYVLTDVTSTGRKLGTGSYGAVEEVLYKHIICAGKKLHETLLDVENEGVAEMIRKYLQECQLMSSLHHPNITQFLGLCFLPQAQLPLLVMEKLETSLDDLLEHMPNLPLSLKRSMLENVASGLLYLHDRNPSIIHRDLTAKNVLLTSSLIAKITDMGNSRIVNGQMARTLSKIPGTLVYMPPEAMDDTHRYGPSLDVFSFGHLALYTIIQVFPGNLLSSTFVVSADDPDNIQPRSEIERREVYIEHLEAIAQRSNPTMVELIKQCLHNCPSRRPSTEELLTSLQGMKVAIEGEYGGGTLKLDLTKARLAREVKEKDRRIEELVQREERQRELLQERERLYEEMEGTIHDQVEQIAMKERETAVANDRNQQLQTEIEQKDREIQQQRDELTSQTRHLQVQIQMLEQQLNESIATLRTKDDENQHLQNVSILSSEQNRQLQDQLQALNEELTEKQQLHEMEMEAREDKLHSMQDLLHDKDEQIQQMLKEIESKEGHLNRLRDELDVKEGQNLRQQAELEAKDETIKQRIEDKNNEIEAVIEQQRSAVETNKLKVQEQDGIINVLNLQVEKMNAALQLKEAELHHREAENSRLREKCQSILAVSSAVSPGISFDWRCGPDMHCDGIGNFQMGGYVQSVVIEGTVYVGGGKASADRLNAYIMGFSSGKWFHLPRYKASFAMAAVKKKLVLVGGEDRLKKRVKLLAMWDPSAQTWTHPYPDMVTARSHCSAVAFKEWLIVAGGLDSGRNLLSSVEVLNTESKQWHAGPPTPLPWHSMKTAIVGDIGYFVGGETPESSNASINTLVYCLSSKNLLSMLQSKKNEKLEIWRELPEHPLGCSAPLSTGQCLFTVGGVDRDLEPMTDVYLYKPVTKSWEKVGDMQTPRCNCTCVAIMEVLVAGGFRDEHGKLNRVDIATLV